MNSEPLANLERIGLLDPVPFSAQFPQALRVIMTPENFAQFSSNPRGFLQQVEV